MSSNNPFIGRLGITGGNIPQKYRNGICQLQRGRIYVKDGSLRFSSPGFYGNPDGDYEIPHQQISAILIGPGTSITHDALRILGLHGTLLMAIGDGGTRLYSAPPSGTKSAEYAKLHATVWTNPQTRFELAMDLFELRFDGKPPSKNLNELRGIEGVKMREFYKNIASQYRLLWNGRHYDRNNPQGADLPNLAINYASSYITALAEISVAATCTIPSLGFIHETSAIAFALDIADIYRLTITTPVAFLGLLKYKAKNNDDKRELEQFVRREANEVFVREQVIDKMIDNIKTLFQNMR